MKLSKALVIFALLSIQVSCSKYKENPSIDKDWGPDTPNESMFSLPDSNALRLEEGESGAARLAQIIEMMPTRAMALELGDATLPSEQEHVLPTNTPQERMAQIKAITDGIVKDCEDDFQRYEAIFDWIGQNINYGQADNDAFEVLSNRVAVCQGFTNLLRCMCYTQGIASIGVYGQLGEYGAHAWAYVYAGRWIVSDPTNGAWYELADMHKYENSLIAQSADRVFFEDECFKYAFVNANWAVCEILPSASKTAMCSDVAGLSVASPGLSSSAVEISIPYSAGGLVVTHLNLWRNLPDEVNSLYLGENIEDIGDLSVEANTSLLKNVFVQQNNIFLENYKGLIYKRGADVPYFIPPALKLIELKPIKVMGKNFIYNHMQIRKLILPKGIEKIEEYAVENCPNLLEVVIPSDCQYTDKSFVGVSEEFKVKISE